jgi:quercetin dioxygenase-like cupin family protein
VTIETISLRGAHAEVLVPGASAGNAFTILRYTAPPEFVGGPPHRHAATVEAFHVLEGALTVLLDGAERVLQRGDTIAVPSGSVHAFRNDATEPAVFLVIAAPPGLEVFLRELADLIAEQTTWPPRDSAPFARLGLRHDQLPPEGEST